MERAGEICENINANGGKATTFWIDQADEGATAQTIESVVRNLGSFDVLVNNAQMAKGVAFSDLDGLKSDI